MRSFGRKAVKIASALYLILALACAIGGLAILVTIFSVGGSPGLGYVERGHYFVGNHGHYTEVSAAFFKGFVKAISYEEGLALLLGWISAPVVIVVSLKRAWDLAKEEFCGGSRP